LEISTFSEIKIISVKLDGGLRKEPPIYHLVYLGAREGRGRTVLMNPKNRPDNRFITSQWTDINLWIIYRFQKIEN